MAKPLDVPQPIKVINADSSVDHYKSLDAAVAGATDGDTIQLKSATYDIGTLAISEDVSITGAHNGKTVLDGGIQLSSDVDTFSISNVTIEDGTPNSDWSGVNIGLYAFGSTDVTISDVTFTDTTGPVDMVGVSARTAGSGEADGSVFTISDSTFAHLANGVDVESGVSASIDSSTFIDAAIVTNSNDQFSDFLSVTNTDFQGDSGIVFVAGNTWSELTLENNTGNDGYFFYDGPNLSSSVQDGFDVQLEHVTVLADSPWFLV